MNPRTDYTNHVQDLERSIGDFGFHSIRGHSLLDEEAIGRYSDMYQSPGGEARLSGRTPAHMDRDRILFSDAFRRQDDKFHVLYFGNNSIKRARNYTGHALKAAHVARTIASRLKLNLELAEAIVLGAKVGGTSFTHRARHVVDQWARDRISELDKSATDKQELAVQQTLLDVNRDSGELVVPGWISIISSPSIRGKVERLLPWAAGSASAPPYHSGLESYWTLTTNSYLRRSIDSGYLAETMYGLWRHSLEPDGILSTEFKHSIALDSGKTIRKIEAHHATHETVLGRYCDDITWVIENLNEASRIHIMDDKPSMYELLLRQRRGDFDSLVASALGESDSGKIYSYFIDDIVTTTHHKMKDSDPKEQPSETEPVVAMSPQAARTLKLMKEFLDSRVFSDIRIKFRNETLDMILRTALDLLYSSHDVTMPDLLGKAARLEGWDSEEELNFAKRLLNEEPVHRIQVTIDLLASMSDREVFELIGLE